MYSNRSDHFLDDLVDELLSVSEGTVSLSEGVSLDLEATKWGRELEGPQEVVGLLELGSAGHDLVDQVLDAGDAVLSKGSGDDAVVVKGDSSPVDDSVASLVDQVGHGLSGRVAVSDEWLDHLDHVPGGLVQLDEHSVVQLSESQELEDLLGLGGKLSDTI